MYGYEVLHEEILDSLIRNVRRRTSQHAYIFEGERGGGSLEGARLFANALVCEREESAPCGVCNACILAKAGSHPDLHFVTPQKDKKNITVDIIRGLLTDAYTKPYETGKKVYIITYGDEMNEQAQNALLKLLEEPPEYAVFIILAENAEALLATIRSRCEKIKFPPVSEEKTREWLKKHYPDNPNTDFLARYSQGNIERAKNLAEEEDFMPLRQGAFELLPKLLSKELLESYDVLNFVEANKENAEQILKIWLGFLRDIMLLQNDGKKFIVNTDFTDRLINMSDKYDEEMIVNAASELFEAQEMQRRYVNLHTLILGLSLRIKKGDKKQ